MARTPGDKGCLVQEQVLWLPMMAAYRDEKLENEILEAIDKVTVVMTTQQHTLLSSKNGPLDARVIDEMDDIDKLLPKATTPLRFPFPVRSRPKDSSWRSDSGRSRAESNSQFLAPIHGHHWPFDRSHVPSRSPVRGAYSVEGTFLWAVGLFGTVQNGALVLTTLCSRKIRKPLHILVGSLAFTDLFISMIYIPSYTYFLLESNLTSPAERPPIAMERQGARIVAPPAEDSVRQAALHDGIPWSFCVVSRWLFVEVAGVTLTIKALIAVYLNTFTVSKELARAMFTIRNTMLLVIFAWLSNFCILFIPMFFGFDAVDFYPNGFVCKPGGTQDDSSTNDDTSSRPSLIFYSEITLSVHLIELLIILASFINVHRAIKKGKLISEKHKLDDKHSQLSYVRATKTTILVFASFLICWVPIYVVNFVDPFKLNPPEDLRRAAMDLLLFKSCVNPMIYIYGIRSLRHDVKLFCMCKCRVDPRNLDLNNYPRTSSDVSGAGNTPSTGDYGV